MDAIRKNLFWCGIGFVLFSLLTLGGWEIWGGLGDVSAARGQYSERKQQWDAEAGKQISPKQEKEHWERKRLQYEGAFETNRQHLMKSEEVFEDVYLDAAVGRDFRDETWKPDPTRHPELQLAKTKHWTIRRDKEKSTIPALAFAYQRFYQSTSPAMRLLAEEGKSLGLDPNESEKVIKLPFLPDKAGDERQVFNWHKAYWGSRRLVLLLRELGGEFRESMKADPKTAEIRLLEIDFQSPLTLKAGGAGAKDTKELARETEFYRAIPFALEVNVDVAAVPLLVERVLGTRAFRFRDKLVMARSDNLKTRVKVEMDLELWDWEIQELPQYLPQ